MALVCSESIWYNLIQFRIWPTSCLSLRKCHDCSFVSCLPYDLLGCYQFKDKKTIPPIVPWPKNTRGNVGRPKHMVPTCCGIDLRAEKLIGAFFNYRHMYGMRVGEDKGWGLSWTWASGPLIPSITPGLAGTRDYPHTLPPVMYSASGRPFWMRLCAIKGGYLAICTGHHDIWLLDRTHQYLG